MSFSLIAIAGREASRVITTTELMFWRGLIGVVVLFSILFATGGRLGDVNSGQPKLQFGRSFVHFGAQFSWLYCLTLIPLAELFALEFTSPLWVAVFAPLLLGERLTATRIMAAGLGFHRCDDRDPAGQRVAVAMAPCWRCCRRSASRST